MASEVQNVATAEQISRKHWKAPRGYWRWLKRRTAKLWRRAAKQDPEEAPSKRPIAGWCD
jgi:hypothetical protein